ncbi:MAG: NnrU family protein [Gammaproteobacteria bacterium]|nr:NnrU family protein [Gammaproteobacteria bacterium]
MNTELWFLGLSVIVFLGTHIGLSNTPLRGTAVKLLGENGFLAVYSVIASATLAWMVMAYIQAPHDRYIWLSGDVLRFFSLAAAPFVCFFIAAGATVKNPGMVKMERFIDDARIVQGILRITRHPFLWGIALWSAAHMLVTGDLASLIFFGGFFVLSAAGPYLIDSKNRKLFGERWTKFAQETSNIPFYAIVSGRNHFSLAEIGWLRLALAGLMCVAAFYFHSMVNG